MNIIISATSDLLTDQRVNRTASALKESGHKVLVIGRRLKGSRALPSRRYRSVRFNMLFQRGPLFYVFFNLRLAWYLLWKKTDVLYSNDLDTLPANFLVSKIKRLPLIYDSHEYFTGVPELAHRPAVQKIWKTIERYIVPRLKFAITVNESIARLFKEEYNIDFSVIRNVPEPRDLQLPDKITLRKSLGLPSDRKILILQGAGINIQRGAEEAVGAMQFLEGYLLLIVGSGDVIPELKKMTKDLNLQAKVTFIDRQPPAELARFTAAADLGLSLDKDTNINYRFSLPNKLFDYIEAGIPILASNLPEVARIVNDYQVGKLLENHSPEKIAETVRSVFTSEDQLERWKANLKIASEELNWNKERIILLRILNRINSGSNRNSATVKSDSEQ